MLISYSCIFFGVNCLFKSFAKFLIGLFILSLRCQGYLSVLDTSPSPGVCFEISPPHPFLLFLPLHFLNVFEVQRS